MGQHQASAARQAPLHSCLRRDPIRRKSLPLRRPASRPTMPVPDWVHDTGQSILANRE
jgi:hypothetical protein